MTINVKTGTPTHAAMEVVEVYEKEGRYLCVATLHLVVSVVDVATGLTIYQKAGYPEMTYTECIEHVKVHADEKLASKPDWKIRLTILPIINQDLIDTFNGDSEY